MSSIFALILTLISSVSLIADTLVVTFALRTPEKGWSIMFQQEIERNGQTVQFLKGPFSLNCAKNASFEKGAVFNISKKLEIDDSGRVKLLGIPLLTDIWEDKPVIWKECSYETFSNLFEGEGEWAQIFSTMGGKVYINDGKLVIPEVGRNKIHVIARNSIGCIGGFIGDGQFKGSPGGSYVVLADEANNS